MLVAEDESQSVLTATENGYGKRTPIEQFPLRGRGGMGVITLDVTEKTGKLMTLARVAGNEELMVLTEKGTVIRTRVEEVRVTGRNAQGVKIINVNNDSVISAFPIRKEEEL